MYIYTTYNKNCLLSRLWRHKFLDKINFSCLIKVLNKNYK